MQKICGKSLWALIVVITLYITGCATSTPPVDGEGRPLIQKLGTIDLDLVECTPIVFHDKVYRFEWVRKSYLGHSLDQSWAQDGYFRFVEHGTQNAAPPFARGYAFGSAFVDGDTVYVTGTSTERGWSGQRVQIFASRDLRNWEEWTALNLDGFGICNTSICKAEDRYVLMFEIYEPQDQAGLVGSMGAVFSTITGNEIHDIHVRQLFTGAEMAGIKIHGAIDTVISHNRIYRTGRGIWLDWMAQRTRVTGNLLHDTAPAGDLFVEVNHGPLLVDNNLFLSPTSLEVNSQGGSYVHNLITGSVYVIHTEGRQTPYHPAHSTEVAGLADNPSGDERYYNNIFVNGGLSAYDPATLPVFMAGNVFLHGAQPSKHEPEPLVLTQVNPAVQLLEKPDGLDLAISLDAAWSQPPRQVVTTERLGKAKIPDLPYEQPDGSPYRLDTDYFGHPRNPAHPFPGPFEWSAVTRQERKL